jgi:hypothetical protein
MESSGSMSGLASRSLCKAYDVRYSVYRDRLRASRKSYLRELTEARRVAKTARLAPSAFSRPHKSVSGRPTCDARTDADPAVLDEIRLVAENGSPVAQNVLKGTPIRSEVNRI